jgi:hypothetical protein
MVRYEYMQQSPIVGVGVVAVLRPIRRLLKWFRAAASGALARCPAGTMMLGLVTILPSIGCGDDLQPIEGSRFGYQTAAEMPRQGCVAGSLRGLRPAGLYHADATGDGLRFVSSSRIDGAGDQLSGEISGTTAQVVRKSNDDLFVRSEDETTLRVINWCAIADTGELLGSYVRCTDRGCLVAGLRGSQVRRRQEADAQNLTLLGESQGAGTWGPGISVNVRVVDGLAYLVRIGDGLRIVDVRDPAAMIPLGHVAVEFPEREFYNDVKIVHVRDGRRYALLASNVSGVVVVDVSQPMAPFIAARFGSSPDDPAPNVHTLAIEGSRAYLANIRTGLDIFDISQPLLPRRLGRFVHPSGKGFLHDLHVVGERASLNWWDAGMAYVDVGDPAAPRMLGNFADYGEVTSHSSWIMQIGDRTVALHGDEQYGARLNVVDVTEGSATFATSIASWGTRREVSIHNVMAIGNLAVLAYYQDGVRVVDLSNPVQPIEVAWFNTWPGPASGGESFFAAAVGIDVDSVSKTIYVADAERGLLALRLASAI